MTNQCPSTTTWVLQIMPVFFLVGGYANLAGWQRAQAAGTTAGQFVGSRLRRLLWPTAVWALVWLAGELVAAALPGPHRWMWECSPATWCRSGSWLCTAC